MSLRLRLTLAVALVLALVVGGFSVALYGTAEDAALGTARARLEAAVGVLAVATEWDEDRLKVEEDMLETMEAAEDTAYRVETEDGKKILSESLPAGLSAKVFVAAMMRSHAADDRIAVFEDIPGRTWAGFSPLRSVRNEEKDPGPVPPARMCVAVDVTSDWAALARLKRLLWTLGPIVFCLGVGGTWLAVGRGLAPVRAMAGAAARIDERSLSTRVPVPPAADELARLGTSFNAALERLEQAFHRERGFIADASHELRTPVAIALTNLEVTLARPRSPKEYEEALATQLDTIRRMRGIVESLLTLARADAGRLTPQREPVDLAALLRRAVDDIAPVAAARRVDLALDAPAPVMTTGDPGLLRQLVDNLLTNAIRYNREGGRVDVSAGANGHGVAVTVCDTGIGIAPEHLPRLFERFYRVDKGRSREEGPSAGSGHSGAGLGLSIARCIADLHGGAIAVESALGRGSTFKVTLPAPTIQKD
jgi:heavy metal sensor kinase